MVLSRAYSRLYTQRSLPVGLWYDVGCWELNRGQLLLVNHQLNYLSGPFFILIIFLLTCFGPRLYL